MPLGVTLRSILGLPGVAHRQGLPDVSVRLVPVHDAATVLRVDLQVYWPVWGTFVPDAAGPDSCHDIVELGLAHSEGIVLYGKRAIGLVEVGRQAFVHIDRAERTRSGLCPRDAEEGGEQFRRRFPVARWNYRVVEFNAHRGYPCREQWVGRVLTPNELARPRR